MWVQGFLDFWLEANRLLGLMDFGGKLWGKELLANKCCLDNKFLLGNFTHVNKITWNFENMTLHTILQKARL